MQKRWLGVQQGLAFLMSALASFLSAFSGLMIAASIIAALFFTIGWGKQTYSIVGVVVVGLIVVTFGAIARQGFTVRAFRTIAIAFALAFVLAVFVAISFYVAFASAFADAGTNVAGMNMIDAAVFIFIQIAGTFTFAVFVSIASAVTSTFAVNFASAVSFIVALAVAVVVSITSAIVVAIAATLVTFGPFAGAFGEDANIAVAVIAAFAFAVAIASFLFGLYCRRRACQGDAKFAIIRSFGLAFRALGGASFCGADLTHANFSQAMLKCTNFNPTKQQSTILKWVNWQNAKKLDFARVGNSLLANPALRDWLVTRNGYKKNYIDADLRAANLDGINFEQANLTRADLSGATLRCTNLKNANLTESLVLNTNFTGAHLTGTCLEAWRINSHTILEQVDCQYVYLRHNRQARRPSRGNFASGEFTQLF